MASEHLPEFEAALTAALGKGRYPLELVGDLDDLLFDIGRLGDRLRDLLNLGPGFQPQQTRSRLVQILVDVDDVALTAADVKKGLGRALDLADENRR